MNIGKDLVAASAAPIVLSVLSEGPSYGYAIAARVNEVSAGRMQWADGMLYPLLHRLEKQGAVESSWGKSPTGRKRKYYEITARGKTVLAEQQQQWHVVVATLGSLWGQVRRAHPPTRIWARLLSPVRHLAA